MNARPRLIAGTLALVGVVCAYQTLALSSSPLHPPDPSPRCEELHEWAVSYVAHTPAPTLEMVARFDPSERLAIFAAATPDVRAALAREQLTRLADSPGLSSGQRAVIAATLPLLTPALYAQDSAARARMAEMRPRIVSAFPPSDVHANGWLILGSVVDKAASPAVSRIPGCNCNINSGQCGCVSWDCNIRDPGCGYGFSDPCNGRCP